MGKHLDKIQNSASCFNSIVRFNSAITSAVGTNTSQTQHDQGMTAKSSKQFVSEAKDSVDVENRLDSSDNEIVRVKREIGWLYLFIFINVMFLWITMIWYLYAFLNALSIEHAIHHHQLTPDQLTHIKHPVYALIPHSNNYQNKENDSNTSS